MTKVRIETGSRLHLGLLDMTGDMGRVDGGIGIALEQPRLVLEAQVARRTSSNLYSQIVETSVERLNEYFDLSVGVAVNVREHFPQHVGLGSSTQIMLSLGRAYAHLSGLEASTRELARILGRGGTSGIGVAAFEEGGFIIDAGHSFGPGMEKESFLPSRVSRASPAPVAFRSSLPKDWVIDVLIPQGLSGLSGGTETEFFASHCPIDPQETCRIARVVNSIIIPGVLERDITTFARGINLLTTLGFKAAEIQNQSPLVIEALRNLNDITLGSAGVGMSSFGPTLFVISTQERRVHYASSIERLVVSWEDQLRLDHTVTACRNHGARVASS